MPARVRMGSKCEIFRFFNSGYAHDRNIAIFGRRASNATQNTWIKPNYASVRQSRDSLHRDRHNVTKKSQRRRALKSLELKSWKNSRRRVFSTLLCLQIWCKSIKNWRRYSTKTAIMDKLVIAMYRLIGRYNKLVTIQTVIGRQSVAFCPSEMTAPRPGPPSQSDQQQTAGVQKHVLIFVCCSHKGDRTGGPQAASGPLDHPLLPANGY